MTEKEKSVTAAARFATVDSLHIALGKATDIPTYHEMSDFRSVVVDNVTFRQRNAVNIALNEVIDNVHYFL